MGSLTEPAKIIAIMRMMLTELENALSQSPEPVREGEDARTNQLKTRIDRLDGVLKQHQAANRRRKELERENRKNNPAGKSR